MSEQTRRTSDVCTGSEPGFYQWSRGVRMRANLDMLLDWAQAAGLGELALEHTHTLSSAINLLATPRKNLLQVKDTPHTNTTRSADVRLTSYKSSHTTRQSSLIESSSSYCSVVSTSGSGRSSELSLHVYVSYSAGPSGCQ